MFPLVYGLACGFPMPILMLMQTRRFGTRHFGAIHGTTMLVMSVVGVIVPTLLGMTFDQFGHYRWGLGFAAVALFLSVGLARGLGRMAHGLHPHAGGTAHS